MCELIGHCVWTDRSLWHCQLGNLASNLSQQKFLSHFSDSSRCPCGDDVEDNFHFHYFYVCSLFICQIILNVYSTERFSRLPKHWCTLKGITWPFFWWYCAYYELCPHLYLWNQETWLLTFFNLILYYLLWIFFYFFICCLRWLNKYISIFMCIYIHMYEYALLCAYIYMYICILNIQKNILTTSLLIHTLANFTIIMNKWTVLKLLQNLKFLLSKNYCTLIMK